jgi:hypothetical protein
MEVAVSVANRSRAEDEVLKPFETRIDSTAAVLHKQMQANAGGDDSFY